MLSYLKLTIWAIFWLFLWIFFLPIRRGRENCLTYALNRWDKEGGYLLIRWSRSNKIHWLKWPHFLWIDEIHGARFAEHAVPRKKEHDAKYIPNPWFEPKFKKGDSPEKLEEN